MKKNQENLHLNELKDLHLNLKMKGTVEKTNQALVIDPEERVALKIEIEMDFNLDQSNHTLKIETHPLPKSLIEITNSELQIEMVLNQEPKTFPKKNLVLL